jgi:hypothetical protein
VAPAAPVIAQYDAVAGIPSDRHNEAGDEPEDVAPLGALADHEVNLLARFSQRLAGFVSSPHDSPHSRLGNLR